MDSNHPAGHGGALLGAHHLLATHKRVSEVCCNAACQIIQLVRAVVNEADDRLLIYGWELLQGRHIYHLTKGWYNNSTLPIGGCTGPGRSRAPCCDVDGKVCLTASCKLAAREYAWQSTGSKAVTRPKHAGVLLRLVDCVLSRRQQRSTCSSIRYAACIVKYEGRGCELKWNHILRKVPRRCTFRHLFPKISCLRSRPTCPAE